jgi:hypothetical protein
MQNEEPNKMTFQEFLGKLSILGILIAVYAAIRLVVEYGLGYKNFPFLLCAFAISFLIEAIRSKNKQVICTVVAVAIIIATYYVENVWLYWGLMASGIVTIIVGSRGCKSCESVDSGA